MSKSGKAVKKAVRQVLDEEFGRRDAELLDIARRAAAARSSPAALAKAADALEGGTRLAKAAEDSRLRQYLDANIARTSGSERARYEAAREALDRP